MTMLNKKLVNYSQDQYHYIQSIFNEFKECGPHFMSLIKSFDDRTLYVSNSAEWEKIFIEENIIEKDMFNYIENSSVPRKWICWNNLPEQADPYGLISRRITVCKTIKSASFIISADDSLYTFNFGFDHDLDIEKFIWENSLLIENYTLGIAKILF